VIQADICRYLGNDALVRPGNHSVRLFFPFFLCPLYAVTSSVVTDSSYRVAKDSSSVLIGISHR
jgi:hypothetical protein